MQVFLLGMHRSGTSAVARVLNLMGCYFGVEDVGIEANEENPKGFWERRDVRQVNDAVLRNAQCDWDRVSRFDVASIRPGDRSVYRDAMAGIVLNLDAHRPWFIKEPRCCLTFELWRECLETPACVIVIRDPLDVARSLERRNGMPLEVGLALWEAYNVRALNASRDVERIVISYEALLADPVPVVRRICDVLGTAGYVLREPAEAEMAAFLSDDLRHFSAAEGDRAVIVSAAQESLYRLLRSAEDDNADVTGPHALGAECLEILKDYERNSPSTARRAEDANATLIRYQRVGTTTELALKRLELKNALAAERRASEDAKRWRRELEGVRARNMALLTEASTTRREVAALGDQLAVLRRRTERLDRAVGGAEETLQRKDLELLEATETLREQDAELADLRVTNRGLLDSVDMKERDLMLAATALGERETDLAKRGEQIAEERRIGEGLRASLKAKDGELMLAVDEIRELTGERSRLESAARTYRTRVAELQALMDETVGQIELLLRSRRWRLGHAALSLPHQMIGRPRPRTVADHLLTLRGDARVRQRVPDLANAGRVASPAQVAEPAQSRTEAATPELRRKTTVLVLAWDVGHNPLGRAYLVAEALARSYTVVLAGFQFPRYGEEVWRPLRDAPFRTVSIPGRPFPDFQRAVESLSRRIDADVIVACKARLPAVQAGLMCKAFRNRPLLIDVDDYELSFFANREPLPYLSQVESEALVEPFEEAWTRYTENLLPWADALLVSNAELSRKFGGVVVPHARDETVFDPERVNRDAARRALGLARELRIVLFVGTPRPHKGIIEVLEAVRLADREDFRCVVVGTPPDKGFEAELRTKGGDSLVLLPDQPFDRLAEITASADLVCLLQDPATEIARYQLPAKVVDAIALGVPVLATDVPPLEPLIRLGAVEAVTSETLPERIQAWLDAPADTRAAQAERAREAFLRHYSYAAIHRTLYNEIERCLRSPKALPGEAAQFLADQARRYPPMDCQRDDGLDLVMFWKQGDVGIYGRRFDMLVRELARRAEVRRIAIFDAPYSVYHVLRDHVPDVTVHHQDVAEKKLVRRWGLADSDKVTHHVFLFDNHHALPEDQYPHMSKFADFVAVELDGVGIEPGQAVFWYYPILEQFEQLRGRFRPRLKVVDVVDDQRTWPNRSEEDRTGMTRQYQAVVADADVVLANCETVRDAMSEFGGEVALVPNGCDTDPSPPEPTSRSFLRFRELPGPILGLVGNLEGKTDLALLDRLANERSDYQIVLIGSTHTHADILQLDEYPNVHFFGIVEYPEVKAWVRHFDVALLPHLDTEQTRSMHPLKMLVYAAAGVPIVSTRIENLGDFEPFINVAVDHDAFVDCVDAVVAGAGVADREALAAVVASNAWSRRVDDIMALIDRSLAGQQDAASNSA